MSLLYSSLILATSFLCAYSGPQLISHVSTLLVVIIVFTSWLQSPTTLLVSWAHFPASAQFLSSAEAFFSAQPTAPQLINANLASTLSSPILTLPKPNFGSFASPLFSGANTRTSHLDQ